MQTFHPYQYVPIGSLSLVSEQERLEYVELFQKTPPRLRSMLCSNDTGSYLLGLARTYNIPEENTPKLSQLIFLISVGKKTMIEISKMLSSTMGLPADQAQNMASEIERDIFSPLEKELEDFLIAKNPNTPKTLRLAPLPSNNTQNILNLKELSAAKKQDRLPIKQPQGSLPSRTTRPIPVPNKLPAAPSVTPKPSLPPRPETPSKRPSSPIKPISFI